MKYPYEFSPQDLARVEAERIKAKRELEKARSMEPPEDWPQRNWDYLAFNAYILRVFLAFGRAACALAARGQWQIDRVRDEAQKFLLRFTLEACGEEGRDR